MTLRPPSAFDIPANSAPIGGGDPIDLTSRDQTTVQNSLKQGVQSDPNWNGANGGFFNVVGLAISGIASGINNFLDDAARALGSLFGTVQTHDEQIIDLQDKTQVLEDIIGYGCAYMNNNTQWSVFQSSRAVHFDRQVGPIVGATMDGTGFVLQSKGLWRADCQMTFDVYAVGNYAIDMDIVVLDPAGNVFARKNYHDVNSNYVTRTNIFSFVVPSAGYKVQVWSASGAGRGQLGGPVRTGFNVTKISGETS